MENLHFLSTTMNINTDFINPKDAPVLMTASNQDFLATDVVLDVRSFENADLYPADQHGALYVKNQAVFDSQSTTAPPPLQFIAMKRLFA